MAVTHVTKARFFSPGIVVSLLLFLLLSFGCSPEEPTPSDAETGDYSIISETTQNDDSRGTVPADEREMDPANVVSGTPEAIGVDADLIDSLVVDPAPELTVFSLGSLRHFGFGTLAFSSHVTGQKIDLPAPIESYAMPIERDDLTPGIGTDFGRIQRGPRLGAEGNSFGIVIDGPTDSPLRNFFYTLQGLPLPNAHFYFGLRNIGDAPLVILSVSLPSGFVLSPQPFVELTIEPGEYSSFRIQLDFRIPGVHQGLVEIETNEADEPYTFAIRGVVSDPGFNLYAGPLGETRIIQNGDTTPDPLNHTDFGTAMRSDDPTLAPIRRYTIHNTSETPLELHEITLPEGFLLAEPVSIFGGEIFPVIDVVGYEQITHLYVRLDTSTEGVKEGEIRIVHSDAAQSPFTFQVRGEVTPEIFTARFNVFGNERGIVNRNTAPDVENHTHFGNVFQGLDAIRMFAIRNTGNLPVTVGQVSAPEGFTILTQPAVRLEAGETTTFVVQMDTSTPGILFGEIRFSHDAGNLNPFSFLIQGQVLEPGGRITVLGNDRAIANVDVSPAPIDHTEFVTYDGRVPSRRTYTIRNDGMGPLQNIEVQVPKGFALLAAPAPTIAPGETTTFQVELDTATPGAKVGTITIRSSDAVTAEYTFAIRGNVLNP